MKKRSLYYVYLLTDEMGEVFYVGKGKGDRAQNHTQNSILRWDSSLKADIIRHIQNRGGEVKIRYLAYFEVEQHAFVYEAAMIEVYGLHHLANKQSGTRKDFRRPYSPLGEVEYIEQIRDTDFNRYVAHRRTRQSWEDHGVEIS